MNETAVLLVIAISAVFWGVAASTMAQRRGLNDRAWFCLGVLVGGFACLYLWQHPAAGTGPAIKPANTVRRYRGPFGV